MNYVRLGNLCVINSGGTPRRNNESYWKNGDIPWVKISDLKNGVVESTEEFITLDGLNNSSAKIFPRGTLLYTIFATIGEVAILKMDAATNQAIVGIQLKENQKVYLKYIYYYLKSQTNNIKQLGRGVAQNNINLSVVKNMIIPIVSLEKQSNIIATLNKLEKIKKNRITILNCLDDLIKSRFVEMFGNITERGRFKVKRWKEVLDIFNGKDYKNVLVNKDGYPVYGSGGIIARANDYICPAGTIIIGRKGSINNPILVNEKFWNVDTAFGIVPKEILNTNYLFYFCKQYNFNRLNKATTLPSLTKRDLLEIEINIPELEEQIRFSSFVNQINKLKSDVQKSIDETQLLMDSLMQEYFG